MSDTVYFRPLSVQPYYLLRISKWLVKLGKFTNVAEAYDFLDFLEKTNGNLLKHYISEYHRVHNFKTGYLVYGTDTNAFRRAVGPYGEESHMYYSRSS